MLDAPGFRDATADARRTNGHAGSHVTDEWPAPIGPAALIGLAGDFVGLLAPHSEADPAALLIQFLVAFGNAVGQGPHFLAEADRHGANLFANVVAETSKGRKGTSWGRVYDVFSEADPTFKERTASGLSSGEGLIYHVRDVQKRSEPIKEGRKIVGHEERIVDEGVSDKRLLVVEGEFASVLSQLKRDGNTLSAMLRLAWDSGNLRTLTKNSPTKATAAHISVIGHITYEELRNLLTRTQAANGFGNRFLWVCARRSKLLPDGGQPDRAAMNELSRKLKQAIEWARDQVCEMARTNEARDLWHKVYAELSKAEPGLLGAMTARAEAQVMRLACVYALLDKSAKIRAEHLKAAIEVWRYCRDSARFIFGKSLGDPIQDRILSGLQGSPAGLTKTELNRLCSGHTDAADLDRALAALADRGLAERTIEANGSGRNSERWRARRV